MKFREWLKEREDKIKNFYDMNGLQSKEEYKDKVVDNFSKISVPEKLKAKKLFSSFKYIIKDNTFYIFRELNELNELDLFIVFTTHNKIFNVKVIRNLSNERNLSFKVYRAILDLNDFNEITTGDALTLNNISAHKKALNTFKIYIRTKEGDIRIEDEYDINYYMKRDNPNELFVLKESGQLRYIRENFNANLDETLDEYIDFYFKEDTTSVNEIQQTGEQNRNEFSAEKEWNRFSKLSKLLKEYDGYSLYKYYDYLFLIKDNKYVAHLDGITDKLLGKKAFYITVMYSEERGAMEILFNIMRLTGYKYIVSDTMLSNDALKFHKKLNTKLKYFAINYKDEEVKHISDEELYSDPAYRIVNIQTNVNKSLALIQQKVE